jgi:hypothetical protein
MLMLTEGSNWLVKQRRVVGGEGRAARTGGARGGRRCRGLRASGHRGSTRGDPAKILRGLGRSGDHRRRSILVETELTGNGGHGEIRRRERASVARVAVAV